MYDYMHWYKDTWEVSLFNDFIFKRDINRKIVISISYR